jgi:hypothetical protein
MKQLSILLLLCFALSFGETKNTHNQQKIENKVTEQSNVDNNYEIKKLEYQNEILKERLEQASDTINNQNSIVSGFSLIYTIITIIIALLGITLPILTYFFGIRPSQKALSEFEKNIDKKMEEYIENSRNNQIEEAIENLSGNNQELIINAINYLNITAHQGFKETQIFNILKVLRESELDDSKKGAIANLFISKKSSYATDYFKSAIFLKGNIKTAAIRYFANNDLSENLELFRQLLKNANDQNSEFYTIVTYCMLTNKLAVNILFNDKKFIDIIDQNFGKIIKSNLSHGVLSFAESFGLSENEMKETYLYEKFK